MLGNWVVETCTGGNTGAEIDTFTLLGVVSDYIPFSKRFLVDGVPVKISIKTASGLFIDSMGTYNTATNKIEGRWDINNYDGTNVNKQVDGVNIDLGVGTHEIRCCMAESVSSTNVIQGTVNSKWFLPHNFTQYSNGDSKGGGAFTELAGRIVFRTCYFAVPTKVSEVSANVTFVEAASNFRLAMYEYHQSSATRAGKLIFETGDLSSATLAQPSEVLAQDYIFEGLYIMADAGSGIVAKFDGEHGIHETVTVHGKNTHPYLDQTYGAFPADMSATAATGFTGWGSIGFQFR